MNKGTRQLEKVAARFDLSKSFVQKLIKIRRKLKVMSNQNSRVEA